DIKVGDGAGNPRGNQRDSAVDVGVVGADVAFDVAIVVKTGNRGGGGDNDRHYQQDPAYELQIHRMISEAGRSRRVFEWLAHLLQRLTMTNAGGCQTNRDDRARLRRASGMRANCAATAGADSSWGASHGSRIVASGP